MGFSIKTLKESFSLEDKINDKFWSLPRAKLEKMQRGYAFPKMLRGLYESPFCSKLRKMPKQERLRTEYLAIEEVALRYLKIKPECFYEPGIIKGLGETAADGFKTAFIRPWLYVATASGLIGNLIAKGENLEQVLIVPGVVIAANVAACGLHLLFGHSYYNTATKTIVLSSKQSVVEEVRSLAHEFGHHLKINGDSKILSEGFAEAIGCKLVEKLATKKKDMSLYIMSSVSADILLETGIKMLREGRKRFYLREGTKPYAKGFCLIKMKEEKIGDRVYKELAKGNYQILLE